MSDRQLEAAERLETLRKVEALNLANRGAWSAMSQDMRAAYAEAVAATPEGQTPPGAAEFSIQRRLAMQGPAPWHEESELRRRANDPQTRTQVSDWLGRMARQVEEMRAELDQTPTVGAYAARANELTASIKAQEAALAKIEQLDDFGRYLTFCKVSEAGADSSEQSMSDAITARKEDR